MPRYAPLLLLAAALGACGPIQDFSPEHALDMPSATEKAYAALAKGDNPVAVRWFTAALVEKPDDPYLTVDLAAAYQRLGRFDDARKLYQTVIDRAAGIVPAKVDDAKLQGRDLSQIAASDLAICSACGLPDPAIGAYQAFAKGDFAAAAGQFEAALASRPDDLYLQLDLAATDRRLGRNEAAHKLYQAVADKAKALPAVTPPPAGAPAPPSALPSALPPAPPGKSLADIAAADLAADGK